MSLEGFELMVLAFNGELRQQIHNPARAHRTGRFGTNIRAGLRRPLSSVGECLPSAS